MTFRRAFTLIELLVAVAIIAILAAIGIFNLRLASLRALRSSDAANLHTIAVALQSYSVDFGTLPPADREAGPFQSHGEEFLAAGNGPAGGGSWDGIPWLLYDLGYVSDWRTLFCPRYLKLYPGGKTLDNDYPRFHNFRYAYNAAALSSGGLLGGQGNIMDGTVWIVRDLWLSPQEGFYGGDYPNYPADFTFPWGEGDEEGKMEQAIYSDMGVRLVRGGE